MMDIKKFADSTVALLSERPERYKNFGPYWFLVKEVLKRFYTKDNLYLLGGYRDQSIIDLMPKHESLPDAIEAAVETYRANAMYGLGRVKVGEGDGDPVELFDEDAGV